LPIGWNEKISTPETNQQIPVNEKISTPETNQQIPVNEKISTPETNQQIPVLVGKKVLGWLISALAISMGAAFWFDVLGKFINVRNAGKKPQATNRDPRLDIEQEKV
jgi:hypothetical protein